MQAPQRFVRETDLRLPAGFWLKKIKLTWIPFLSPHFLMRFIARLFTSHLCFRLRGLLGLTAGLAIGGAILIVGKVAISLLG